MKKSVLTKKERDVLILGSRYVDCKHLSTIEIAESLGLSVSCVKTTIHRACAKLRTHNKTEAIVTALKSGEINFNELYSFDEITERLSSLGPNVLRKIAYILRQGIPLEHLGDNDELIIYVDRKQNTTLTKTEREILVLAGFGLSNKKIADRLCISIDSVRTLLYRVYTKLGASRRADALVVAIKQGDMTALDVFPPNELIRVLAPLGAESLEKMAQLLDQQRV